MTHWAHLSFELGVHVCEDESRNLHQRDNEGAFGQSTQMVANGTNDRGEDGGRWQLGLIPSDRNREQEVEAQI